MDPLFIAGTAKIMPRAIFGPPLAENIHLAVKAVFAVAFGMHRMHDCLSPVSQIFQRAVTDIKSDFQDRFV
jgi:hypothetical protein